MTCFGGINRQKWLGSYIWKGEKTMEIVRCPLCGGERNTQTVHHLVFWCLDCGRYFKEGVEWQRPNLVGDDGSFTGTTGGG